MRIKRKYIFILLFIITSLSASSNPASARSKRYRVHAGPGVKFKVVGWVRRGGEVKVLKETSGWVLLKLPNGVKGWISRKVFRKRWKRKKKQKRKKLVHIDLEFQNIPENCTSLFTKALPELKKKIEPVGDDAVELVVSLIPRLRSFHLFLMVDFNPSFYRHTRKRFAEKGSIDLMPFSGCLWALHAYKRKLIQSLHSSDYACAFIRRLVINIILKKLNGDRVILQSKEDGGYITFSPVLLFERADGGCIKLKSENPGKVGMLSAFQLPYLQESDPGIVAAARGVYNFFGIRP